MTVIYKKCVREISYHMMNIHMNTSTLILAIPACISMAGVVLTAIYSVRLAVLLQSVGGASLIPV